MPDVVIRAFRPADISAITRIYAHAVLHGTASFEIDPPDEGEMMRRQRRQQALAASGHPALVAEDETRTVIGYACAGPYRARPAYHWSVEDSIYVTPHAHRRGIGRLLLDRLIVETGRRGFRQMIAVIGDSQQTASIALHRAAGFRLVGTFEAVGFKFNRWLDTVLMQRPLGPGAAGDPREASVHKPQ